MTGLEEVSRAVADVLAGSVAAKVEELAGRLGPVAAGAVDPTPAVVYWTTQDVGTFGMEDWPAAVLAPQGKPARRRSGITADGGLAYDVDYTFRLFLFVRGDGFEEVAAVRSRLELAATEVLLQHQRLGVGDDARLDETSLVSSYSDVVADPTLAATVGGAYVAFTVTVHEVIPPLLAGSVAASTSVRTAPLP